MKTNIWLWSALLLAITPLHAQVGGDFEIVRSTLDGGGGYSTGGTFELTGTIAQPEADPNIAIGGDFSLRGGFHRGGTIEERPDLIFHDGFED